MTQNILNFDPRKLVQPVENSNSSSYDDGLTYKCNPKLSKSEDGHYRATIKVIYNPHNIADSVVERQVYSMNDEHGWFEAVSVLSNNSYDCPIFQAWLPLYRSKNPEEQRWALPATKGGTGWFNKRNERWVTIQVIEDKNQPELQGKYMLWKIPTFVWKLIDNKQAPSVESGKPSIPVMDFLIGRAVSLEVTPGPDDPSDPTRKNREIKYDLSELTEDPVACTNPDGSSLLTDEQEEILEKYLSCLKKIWKERDVEKRNQMYEQLAENEITKKFSDFYNGNIIETIASFCPNVKEERQYKGWDDALTERVNKWLAKVTKGIDPQQVVNETAESVNTATVAVGPAPTVTAQAVSKPAAQSKPQVKVTQAPEEDDELPF